MLSNDALMRISLPATDTLSASHLRSLDLKFWTNGSQYDTFEGDAPRVAPRNLKLLPPIWNPNTSAQVSTFALCSPYVWMLLLWKLILKPDNNSKHLRILLIPMTEWRSFLMKRITSSAYWRCVIGLEQPGIKIPPKTLSEAALFKSLDRTSPNKLKISGDRGLPCLRPLSREI